MIKGGKTKSVLPLFLLPKTDESVMQRTWSNNQESHGLAVSVMVTGEGKVPKRKGNTIEKENIGWEEDEVGQSHWWLGQCT